MRVNEAKRPCKRVGYELLRCHVETSDAAAAAAGVPLGDLATFVRGDMLDAPLGEAVRVVVLTSQCWDRGLHDRAARRLAEGLTVGALVVDYGGVSSNHAHLFCA